MIVMRAMYLERRWFALGLAALLFCGTAASESIAEDPAYVMRDGRKVRLIKSESELGIVFRADADIVAGRRRLEAAGRGRVEDVEQAPRARIKLLRVPDTAVVKRGLVRQDPDIEHVGTVYRFAGYKTPAVSTGTLVVKVWANLSADEREQLWRDYGVRELERIDGLHDVYSVEPIAYAEDGVSTAEGMATDERTLWAHPNFWRFPRTRQVAPSDAFFTSQWHLNNTGQFGGAADADIDAPEAWLIAEGQDVLIGMLDDACDVDHEDLRDNYSGTGHDPSLDSQDAGFDDPRPKQIFDRHGTAVMGLAVARANEVGGRGVAYLSRFTASRGLEQLNDEQIARSYIFARQQRVDVHINSWGLDGPNPPIVEDAIEIAFTEGRDLDGEEGEDPPLGMVIVFAAGNDGVENVPGFELSTLPEVMSVGASNDRDERALFSNFGAELNLLAPGGSEFSAPLFTTDNEDRPDSIDWGFNIDGVDVETGFREVDPTGSYTSTFGGTSAACPIVAGVAALVLSVNRQLSATDVRIILEHTSDPISKVDAEYNGITSLSLFYGYGRVNARQAAEAAQESLTNGGRTWPGLPRNTRVLESILQWEVGTDTDDFLVVESTDDFSFAPQDGLCYDRSQVGCSSATPAPLPAGVSVLSVGCTAGCVPGDAQTAAFELTEGVKKFFAIYGRSSIGRYSFGVAMDSEGGETGGVIDPTPVQRPALTISATPREGSSPLNVQFNGNAVSSIAIDASRTAWDFDVDDGILVDATATAASHTYVVSGGETRTFTARLTMYDVQGNAGTATVQIRVVGSEFDDGGGVGGSEIRIVAGLPGTTGSDVSQGTSPFDVELSIDARTLTGTLQSVVWDLGDGTRAASLVVPHRYINESDSDMVVVVTATVITRTTGGTTLTANARKLLTINPGIPGVDPGQPDLPGVGVNGSGGTATPCGAVGMVPLLFGILPLMWLRRRRS